MMATRITFTAAFCLLSVRAAANARMREQVGASVSASGAVSNNARMREQVSASVSASGAVSNNIEIGLHTRQKKTERAVVSSTAIVSAAPSKNANASFATIIADVQIAMVGFVEATAQFKEGQIQEGLITVLNAAEALVVKYVPANVGGQISKYTDLIQTSITNSDAIIADLTKFKNEADTAALADALLAIIDEIEGYIAQIEQENDNIDTGSILKYFEALEEVIRGSAASWTAFTAGANRDDIVSAIENIYASVRSAVMKIIPEGDITKELEIALTVFDSTIGNLTSIAQGFKQEMEMKVLCMPRSIARSGTTPTVCDGGFKNEGSRCIAEPGKGADCYQACGKKGGVCGSYCGAHTNGQKTVCCKEGDDNPCECRGATGFVVNNPKHPANSYHQCVTAGPWVQSSSLLETARTNASLLESVDQTVQRKKAPKCTQRAASALVDTAVTKKGKPVQKGSLAAQCAPGTGELCEKKCVQQCPLGSVANGCRCRANCNGEHSHEAIVFGSPICGKDAMSTTTYAMDALMAGSTLATLIDYMAKENSIKELSATINAGITLLQKLVIPQCKVPESMVSLLPPGA